jgi:outer membrane biosynthesis protein TonB
MKLNLTANNQGEELIKAYLEANASATLAQKINFGTQITKDGKQLINRKTLAGFFKYATEEARKLATKGANFACVADDTVFGWSIHYFEEEAIEGELFNLDGTPYKAEKKAEKKPEAKTAPKPTPKEAPKAEPKKAVILTPKSLAQTPDPKPTKKQKPTDTAQISIFDLF